jgi:hypothetical protein
LAYGHLVALTLGGCDELANLVPQFEMWQANGAWAAMEREIGADYDGKLMHVEVGYGRDGPEQQGGHAGLTAWGENTFMEWTDRRIPDFFRIRIYDNDDLSPSNIMDGQFNEVVTDLSPTVIKEYSFDLGRSMPREDKMYYLAMRALEAIEAKMDHEGSTYAIATDYVLKHPGAVEWARQQAMGWDGVEATEAMALQAYDIVRHGEKLSFAKFEAKWLNAQAGPDLMDFTTTVEIERVKKKPTKRLFEPTEEAEEEEEQPKKRRRKDH